jgi:hypothetical protein
MGQSEEQLPKLPNHVPIFRPWIVPVHALKTQLTDHHGNEMGEARVRCLVFEKHSTAKSFSQILQGWMCNKLCIFTSRW